MKKEQLKFEIEIEIEPSNVITDLGKVSFEGWDKLTVKRIAVDPKDLL